MAMNTLPAVMRPANPAHVSRMNISVARAVDTARLHLKGGNPVAYARALAGEHCAQNERQQRAIEAVIVSDGMARLFVRHAGNGCLLAREG